MLPKKSSLQTKLIHFILLALVCAFSGFAFCEEPAPSEFVYDSHGKKDPFTAPVVGGAEKTSADILAGVRLEGIIWDPETPIAIINDKVMGIGDEVAGAKIVEIKQNEVIFDLDGKKVNVKLNIKTE